MSNVIKNSSGEYWNNETGWSSFQWATLFTDEERGQLTLPIGGEWADTLEEGEAFRVLCVDVARAHWARVADLEIDDDAKISASNEIWVQAWVLIPAPI
jgi:hypothetical protein